MGERKDRNTLMCFEHMKRMREERPTTKVCEFNEDDKSVRDLVGAETGVTLVGWSHHGCSAV